MRRAPAALAALACALLAGAVAPPVAGAVAPPAGTRARPAARRGAHARAGVQAFLLTGAPDSFADFRAHASDVSVVYPTYYECTPESGTLHGADVPAVDAFAHSRGVPVMPRFTCQDPATVARILTAPALRANLLARLSSLADRASFAGLCLDLENAGPEYREALTSFVDELAARLHAHDRRLTVVVDGVSAETPGSSSYLYDYPALSAAADTIFVLAWGAHWEGSPPGPLAPLAQVAATVRFVSSLPDRARFVIGAPMYGLDWSESPTAAPSSGESAPAGGAAGVGSAGAAAALRAPASAYEYQSLWKLRRSSGAPATREPSSGELTFSYTSHSGELHRVWYMDAKAVLDIVALARRSGLDAGLWRLGDEDQSLWSSPLVGA